MTTGLRETVIQIINRVERKIGLNASVSADSTKKSRELLDLLNEIIDDISDSGDWQEQLREITVPTSSSVATYEIATSGLVKNIHELAFTSAVAPLVPVDINEMRLLRRTNTYGEPRQFAIVGVNSSSGNPNVRVHPCPASAQASGNFLAVLYYQKQPAYTTANGALTVPFPSNLVAQGLYAKALLAENGGSPSGEYQAAYVEYVKMRREVNNRFNSDIEDSVYFRW